MTYTISLLKSEADRKPVSRTVSREELDSMLGTFRETNCDHKELTGKCSMRMGPAWSPSMFNGKGHSAKDVTGMSLLVFDIDHVTNAQLEAFIGGLEPYSCIVHSTHSHNPDADDICLRVVLFPSRPLKVEEIKPVRAAVIKLLALPSVDASTTDLGRIYFLPSVSAKSSVKWFTSQVGRAIDVSSLELTANPVSSRHAPSPVLEGSGLGEVAPIDLDPIRAQLLKVRSPGSRELMRLVVQGKPLSGPGSRSNTINAACSVMAFAAMEASQLALAEVIRQSVEAMVPPETGTWYDVACDSIRRAIERRDEVLRTAYAANAAVDKMFRGDAAAADRTGEQAEEPPPSTEAFTPIQVETWAADQGTTGELFVKRWIIQHGGGYCIFSVGRYATVLTREDAEASVFRDLSRAPIELYKDDKNGHKVPKSLRTLVHEYGTVARVVRSSLVLQESVYDAREQTFHEAVRPMRNLRPTFDAEVQEYLDLFGGAHRETFLDWCALLPNLNQQLCALYMMGEKNTGKSIFAQGAARLWNADGPSTLADALKPFNDTLTRNPFCFADEKLPSGDTIIDDLREFIGNKNRPLNRKFLNTTGLEGCVRLFIAANNDTLLKDASPNVTQSDVEALAQRILFIDHGSAPTKFLEDLRISRGPQYVDTFRSHDRIAKHILYLAHNRPVTNSSRFGVDGAQGDFHEQMITDTESNSNILEFIVRYICDPLNKNNTETHLIVGNNKLLVSTEFCAAQSRWERYIVSRKTPTAKAASNALMALSERETVRIGDLNFFSLKVGQVVRWATRRQVGNIPTLTRRIEEPRP